MRNNDDRSSNIQMERARQTAYADMIGRPRPNTWSANMPAYAGTALEARR